MLVLVDIDNGMLSFFIANKDTLWTGSFQSKRVSELLFGITIYYRDFCT